jgi:hypothetical protein
VYNSYVISWCAWPASNNIPLIEDSVTAAASGYCRLSERVEVLYLVACPTLVRVSVYTVAREGVCVCICGVWVTWVLWISKRRVVRFTSRVHMPHGHGMSVVYVRSLSGVICKNGTVPWAWLFANNKSYAPVSLCAWHVYS